jgi:pimeloyl-ACP methyl ester carboxylesterase
MIRLRRLILGLILLGTIALAALYFFQESLLFPTYSLDQDVEFGLLSPYEEKVIRTDDGANLHMLHLKAEEARGVVVFYHGNGGNMERWSGEASYFLQFGWDVMILDYRGYGKSTGERSSEAMYDDAQLFYLKALEAYDEDKVILYGRSLGSTFATYVAARNNPARLILEAPFADLRQLVKSKYPFLPVERLLRFDFPTIAFAGRVKAPVTILHGDQDQLVPIDQGRQLARGFGPSAEFIEITGGGHHDLADFTRYQRVMEQLFRTLGD